MHPSMVPPELQPKRLWHWLADIKRAVWVRIVIWSYIIVVALIDRVIAKEWRDDTGPALDASERADRSGSTKKGQRDEAPLCPGEDAVEGGRSWPPPAYRRLNQ